MSISSSPSSSSSSHPQVSFHPFGAPGARRSPYQGTRRRLVVAFDVGTTYSGISYAILDPGQTPVIRPVTRFPAHELISGASKIPTVIYYTRTGVPAAFGAETASDGTFERAEDEGWFKAEWFKLHITSTASTTSSQPISSPRPLSRRNSHFASTSTNSIISEIPPLPPRKSSAEILADFLGYLLQCTRIYITDTHPSGASLFATCHADNAIDYVLSHPNGWEGAQQEVMRRAAVLAGLVRDNELDASESSAGINGRGRLSFVTEGEASLHFALESGMPEGVIINNEGVIIVDAGGGTIDISAYARSRSPSPKGTSYPTSSAAGPISFEEIAPPQCHFHGSIFVTIHAGTHLDRFLADSPFEPDIEHILRCFDRTTKPRFRSATEPQYVKFGSTRDNDPDRGIRFGQLKMDGNTVASFFEPSIRCIVNGVLEQRRVAHRGVHHVVLVGGFAASDWLFTKVQEELRRHGMNVIRPDNHVNKAVSDGAISYYIDHFVSTRVSRMVYGNFCHIPFVEQDPEHRERIPKGVVFQSLSGQKRIAGSFDVILGKNVQVSEIKEFRKPYFRESERKEDFRKAAFVVWGYRGNLPNPKWRDVDSGNYSHICTIEVDLSNLTLQPKWSERGTMFYRLDYEIVLLFGLTEFKAQIAYREHGIERRSQAKIIYGAL